MLYIQIENETVSEVTDGISSTLDSRPSRSSLYSYSTLSLYGTI